MKLLIIKNYKTSVFSLFTHTTNCTTQPQQAWGCNRIGVAI